jgi:hypothetical protein
MRLEIFIIAITIFLIYNAYTDGKYTKILLSFKKYYKMIFYALLGIGIYLLLKKNPLHGQKLLLYANNVIKFMPIDKSSMEMLSPIIDFTRTSERSFMESFNNIDPTSMPIPNESKKNPVANKRSVSETKKKYIASQQDWKCGHCMSQLDHTYEIDHRIRLEYGGSNDVQNLVALCRNCHGKKTASENM